MIDSKKLTIRKAHEAMTRGDFSAVDLATTYLEEIKKKNPEMNAYLELYDDVIEQAKTADAKFKAKTATLLTGIPLAIKDNILIKGKRVSCSSKILEGYKATYDATAITKLKNEGAVFLGRTNLDEFAMGGSTENSAFGVTKNPHDTSRVAGGSSGGSAAAVAMDGAVAALGSDTGGSVRQPASFCGVVGLKPTYGAVSRHGLIAMGSSLDQIGPITNSVEDAEIIFDVIAGKDKMDSTSIDLPSIVKKGEKMTIGVPKHFTESEGIDPVVVKNFQESIEKLKKIGYAVKEISLPNVHYSLAVYYILMPAEASTNLSRFDGVKYGLHKEGKNLLGDYLESRGQGFGKEVRRRIILGAYVLSSGYYDAYYNRAIQVKNLIQQDFKKVFKEVDIIITPTAPSPAFKIGEKANDPLQMYLADIFTVTANIVGVPALSVPSGSVDVGGKQLPLGVQFMANYGEEKLLFEIGKKFEGK
jgi:aspartyl-tRNA(Asn)/glutamyl-tRNA(Gln) amidotransferase subunit A